MSELMKSEIPVTKKGISTLADTIIESIMEGEMNIAEVAIKLKSMELLIKTITKDPQYRDVVIEELSKYTAKETVLGAKVAVGDTGVKYDYSGCGHSKLNSIIEEIEGLNEERKKIEESLKYMADDVETFDEETGEQIRKPVRTGTTSAKITLSKK